MKKLILAFCAAGLLFGSGCKKRDTDDISKVVTVSKPTINLKGDKFVSIHVGESYTDPGATSIDDVSGASSDITAVTSTLDVSTPGMYYMLYTSKNGNGYVNNNVRYIAVTNYNDAVDLSGTYARTSNGVEVHVTKVAASMYENDDMGGAGLPNAIYFAVINDSTLAAGPQFSESLGAEIETSNEGLDLNAPITFKYALSAPGYGTAVRTFEKE